MTKDKVYEQKLVVMDVNYEGVFEITIKTIFDVAGEWNEDIISHPLALDHMDKQIVKFKATDKEMRFIQARIEDLYPGLCIFNPPMYV